MHSSSLGAIVEKNGDFCRQSAERLCTIFLSYGGKKMRMSRVAWIALSGAVWFLVGAGLLIVGMDRIVFKAQMDVHETTSWIASLSGWMGGREQAALLLILIALLIGVIKGRFAMGRAVVRVTKRLQALAEPLSLGQVYSKGYLLLIAGMVGLGMGMKALGLSSEIRGFIDIAVGSALMNGALLYFRAAFALKAR
jgi:hypothetical protein